MANQINQFFQFIMTSSYIDQLSEYSVGGLNIGHGAFAGSKTILILPPPGGSISDSAIQNIINTQTLDVVASADERQPPPPPPINNNLYFFFVPPGTSVTSPAGASCAAFCGYHNNTAAGKFYAVIPYPNCSGCASNMQPIDAITMFASHELAEAITDPVPGSGWYNNASGEIGDFCNQQPKALGRFTVQKLWSPAKWLRVITPIAF